LNPGTAANSRGPVLLLFDNSIRIHGTHDVAAAYCLAMADVRVRLPLGALATHSFRTLESLEIRRFREPESVGSNPTVLTHFAVWPNGKAAPC
jgi:hypothetical protein